MTSLQSVPQGLRRYDCHFGSDSQSLRHSGRIAQSLALRRPAKPALLAALIFIFSGGDCGFELEIWCP